jgi:LytR cell envelope-related transcriptional attenuator
MSEQPQESPGSEGDVVVDAPLDRGTGIRAARSGTHFAPPPKAYQAPSRRWMAMFGALLAVAVVAAMALTYVGLKTVRASRAGRQASSITDPRAPGFEAIVEPTPTLVVLDSTKGELRSVAVLSLNGGNAGGSVLLVPPATMVGTTAKAVRLDVIFAFAAQPDDARGAVQTVLRLGITESLIVDDARWAELVGPVAPLTIQNPDDVPGFPAGPVSLSADQVGAWLGARVPGESDLARMYRQQLFWDAWVKAVAASHDPGVVPGEVDAGIGRFLRGLAGGPTHMTVIPLTEHTDTKGETDFVVDTHAMAALVDKLVPFPTGDVEGARTKVRLLDGTGDPDHLARAAPLIIPAGTEIVVAGNAASFDHKETEIRYHNPTQKAAAEHIRKVLGVGKVIDDARPTEAFDVTIILGTDI